MGRVGETWTRAIQTAHHCKDQRGFAARDTARTVSSRNDNNRILRYVAKTTINPALAAGVADHVGSLEPGKLADIVLWPVHSFGAKPSLVLKGGLICWSVMGDPNGSISTPQPVRYRPMYGALGAAMRATRLTFVSQAALDAGVPERLGLQSPVVAVRGCRSVGKKDMVRNTGRRTSPSIRTPTTSAQTVRLSRSLRRNAFRSPNCSTSCEAGMTDVAALLVTLQLTDSAFPAGFYTLSHGLEGYAQTGSVTPATLPDLLADLLRHSVGPADATALALAHNAVRDGIVRRCTEWTDACTPPSSTASCGAPVPGPATRCSRSRARRSAVPRSSGSARTSPRAFPRHTAGGHRGGRGGVRGGCRAGGGR